MSCILAVGDSLLLNGLKAKNVFASKGERNVGPKEEHGGENTKGKKQRASVYKGPCLPSGSLKLLTPLLKDPNSP